MSDWNFLNQHRCRVASRYVPIQYLSTDADGFNGLFRFTLEDKAVRCIASDGGGWQHVSVSIEFDKRCPTWAVMCAVKNLFWELQDWVVQFHPAQSEYVNNHPSCLHLWRCTDGREMPTPPSYMVGLKSLNS